MPKGLRVQISPRAPTLKFMNRPRVNSNFFKNWSCDMAYILGFIVTDGCLVEHKNGYHALNITNKNKEILQAILREMGSNHKISIKSRGGTPNLKYFQIQIRDKILYSDLLKLGLTPRKSKTVTMPSVPPKFFADFARGCFDGDGGVSYWKEPRWKHSWQIRTTFASGSKKFLVALKSLLHKYAGIRLGKIWSRKSGHELHYGIRDSVTFYNYIYKDTPDLYLKRKKDSFEYFNKLKFAFSEFGPIV